MMMMMMIYNVRVLMKSIGGTTVRSSVEIVEGMDESPTLQSVEC